MLTFFTNCQVPGCIRFVMCCWSCNLIHPNLSIQGRDVLLVVIEIADGTEIAGANIMKRELQDLNRCRQYLRDVASRHGVHVYDSVIEACTQLVTWKRTS